MQGEKQLAVGIKQPFEEMKKRVNWIALMIAILGLAALAVLPLFASQYVLFLLTQILIYGSVVALINVAGYSGLLSLGHGGFFAIGAYTTAILATQYGQNVWLTFPVSLVAGALAGMIIGFASLRVKSLYLTMITIAFGIIIQKLAEAMESLTNGPRGLAVPMLFQNPWTLYLVILLFAALCFWISFQLPRTNWGRSLFAIQGDEISAESMGINTKMTKILVLTLSASLTGLAGSFFGIYLGYISPEHFGLDLSFLFVLMLLVGGIGDPYGPFVGSLILTPLPMMLVWFQDYQLLIYGLLYIAAIYLFPKGIMGTLKKLVHRRASKEAPSVSILENGPEWLPFYTGQEDKSRRAGGEEDAGPLLQLRGATKRFGGLVAVNALDLSIANNSIHALIGPNGSGKSTTLNMISGIYRLDEGDIWFDGEDVTGVGAFQRSRMGIARTFQAPRLVNDLTALDNVKMGFYRSVKESILSGLTYFPALGKEKMIDEYARSLLEFVRIPDSARVQVKNLTFAERKLLEIARALATRPRLILLDEPASGLSDKEMEQLIEIVKNLKRNGLTVLLVEHHMDFLASLAERVTVLDFGRKIAEGSIKEISEDPLVIQAYLGQQEELADGAS
ncbi:MAG: branched-chain amino acid ABC transporter ATP-binding protein/permease [Alicyclobacillaceae bacterium]|nr:branched-chain amino acid ABC transporter ATP-binding protein/permease [Alicyclobacillaceae bacterium]